MERLQRLVLWMDPEPRPGPEAMAVDEWLLASSKVPVLRVYGWAGDWGSLGYFGKLADARAALPELQWVRRWTGGGLVDHRADWTYSLVVPQHEALARARGAESYQFIHQALKSALQAAGEDVQVADAKGETGAPVCFENPVAHDLVSASGAKIAGAGQRRTRQGLLHQGSVGLPCGDHPSLARAKDLAKRLAGSWESADLDPDPRMLLQSIQTRYGCPKWTEKRR